jgi:hypothetical protein
MARARSYFGDLCAKARTQVGHPNPAQHSSVSLSSLFVNIVAALDSSSGSGSRLLPLCTRHHQNP